MPAAPKNAGDRPLTPAMRQYHDFKAAHPGCLLMFRMGDFYELFYEDAEEASRALGLTLTERSPGQPMAGVPHHQLGAYLRRLSEQGYRVAVAEQVQDPKEAKGVVERAVTRVVTPGSRVDEELLAEHETATLAAVVFTGAGEDAPVSAAVCDLSTGRFTLLDARPGEAAGELASFGVAELIYPATSDGAAPPRVQRLAEALDAPATGRPAWHFRSTEAREAIHKQFGVTSLAGFGLHDDDPAIPAAGAVVRYLRETQGLGAENDDDADSALTHLAPPIRQADERVCTLDAVSLRALEVERTIRGDEVEGSLLGVFLGARSGRSGGLCRTAMGKRKLRDWLCRPSADPATLDDRHGCVASLAGESVLAECLADALEGVHDIARIAARVALERATPRDLVGLGASLSKLEVLRDTLEGAEAFAPRREQLSAHAEALRPLAERINATCVDQPPARLRDGGLIRDGVDAELDEARTLERDAGAWLADYQTKLIAEHDLPNLKVGFNRVFGYFIELPKGQSARAPDLFTRRQTLKNAERYITPELKDFEDKVTTAEARALERERVLFETLCAEASTQVRPISAFAETVSELDALLAFADKARRRGWVRPQMTDGPALEIHGGRHPVLDETLGAKFVPNDCALGDNSPSLALITGPNMAGKSTYIRQVALLTLLAHAGGFVPADRATIGLTDRIFTRVGADDALHRGQSTFMVEMTETAGILHHATERSLVVLDEIGRGTSTLDGLSLAWAIAETLAGDHDRPGPRTLFATHYHELTDLAERRPDRVGNLHVAVREWTSPDGEQEIVFLHQIEPGRADRSYGLHVAKLAGVPRPVIDRAQAVLEALAVHHGPAEGSPTASVPHHTPNAAPQSGQLPLFTEYLPHPALDRLRELKLDELTPLAAFDALRALQGALEAKPNRSE
ncbi:MAG: DNA mismatch repair protein MutS [Planctomycetota bacterium]